MAGRYPSSLKSRRYTVLLAAMLVSLTTLGTPPAAGAARPGQMTTPGYVAVPVGTPRGTAFSVATALDDQGDMTGYTCVPKPSLSDYEWCSDELMVDWDGSMWWAPPPRGVSHAQGIAVTESGVVAAYGWNQPVSFSIGNFPLPLRFVLGHRGGSWVRLLGEDNRFDAGSPAALDARGDVFGATVRNGRSNYADIRIDGAYWLAGSTKPVVTLRGKSEADAFAGVGAYVGSDPQGDTVGEDAEGYWAVRPAGQPAIRIGSASELNYLTGVARSTANPGVLFVCGDTRPGGLATGSEWQVTLGTSGSKPKVTAMPAVAPLPGDDFSGANGVGPSGVVVGSSDNPDTGLSRAVASYDGATVNLTGLAPSWAQRYVTQAYAINSAGQIAAGLFIFDPTTELPAGALARAVRPLHLPSPSVFRETQRLPWPEPGASTQGAFMSGGSADPARGSRLSELRLPLLQTGGPQQSGLLPVPQPPIGARTTMGPRCGGR